MLPIAPAIRKEATKRQAKGGPGLREETAGASAKSRKDWLHAGHLMRGNAPHFFCAGRGKEADLESPSVTPVRVAQWLRPAISLALPRERGKWARQDFPQFSARKPGSSPPDVDHGKRAFRSVLPTPRFSFAAQRQLSSKNDLRSQATQSVHDVAVAPHASRQALLGLGSDDTWHAERRF
jgi:hypothetical protein